MRIRGKSLEKAAGKAMFKAKSNEDHVCGAGLKRSEALNGEEASLRDELRLVIARSSFLVAIVAHSRVDGALQ